MESNINVLDTHTISGRRRPDGTHCLIMEGNHCINTRNVKVRPLRLLFTDLPGAAVLMKCLFQFLLLRPVEASDTNVE